MLEEERVHLIEEACGVFGVADHPEAANISYLGLHALQHRGQESAGIATRDGDTVRIERRVGLVSDGFTPDVIARLPGRAAIGHVRYSTSGESTIQNAQPLYVLTKFGPIAIAHNGNLTNAAELRRTLEQQGSIFGTTTDTEVVAHLVAKSEAPDMLDAITDALRQIEGAFTFTILTLEFMIAVRDPHGVRPLALGTLEGRPVVASEPSSFRLIGAKFEREIEPGEMLVCWTDGREEWRKPFEPCLPRPCVFELIYFARPDSSIFGKSVYEVRRALGERLAAQHPVEADIVVPVPDSGVPAALGYARASGLPFEMGLVRSHYVGRTFIEPSGSIRNFGVKLKLSPITELLKGKRVVIVDDSIVRGTTSRKIIRMVRDAGATEVHFRVASPPTTHPCFYGIDTPSRSELIAASYSLEAIESFITADSLGYLSREELLSVVSGDSQFCDACFSGQYPIGRINAADLTVS